MELNELIEQVKKVDERLAKRLEPLEKAVSDREQTITELKDSRDALKKALEGQQKDMDDLKRLVRAYNQHTIENDQKQWFKAFGHFVLASMCGSEPSKKRLDEMGIKLAGGTTSGGGALVPEVFHSQLIELMETYGVFRREAQVVPMSSDTDLWPKLNTDVTVYKVGEGGTITASNPAFSNVRLVAEKLACLTAVSSELTEDAALGVGQIVGRSMARALAKAEDQAGFLGDGTSTYWGFVGLTGAFKNNHSSYGSQTASAANGGLVDAAGNGYDEITIGNIRTLVGVLPVYAEPGAKFYCSKRFYFEVLVRLAQAAGGALQAEYQQSPGKQFMGYPVVFVDVMPKTEANDQICLFLGDLKQGAYFGDRRAFELNSDASVYFASDQIGFRATERFAINVFGWGSATTAGPICALVTHSS